MNSAMSDLALDLSECKLEEEYERTNLSQVSQDSLSSGGDCNRGSDIPPQLPSKPKGRRIGRKKANFLMAGR